MSQGRIPVTAIWKYADRHGLDNETVCEMERYFAKMDIEYLKHQARKSKNRHDKPKNEPPASKWQRPRWNRK